MFYNEITHISNTRNEKYKLIVNLIFFQWFSNVRHITPVPCLITPTWVTQSHLNKRLIQAKTKKIETNASYQNGSQNISI